MATKEMTIKLMSDTQSNRLIFAEASKDFVDFLIYLLSLPIATVTKLLSNESMVGSIGNIYTSVANLDETYLRPNVNKNLILNPMFFPSAINTPLSLTGSSINSTRKFYTCSNPKCKRGITNVPFGVQCPSCDQDMYNEIKFIDRGSEGYVHNVASYMVFDDLSITSISTMSIVSMLNKFNVNKPEERMVKIGTEEALELLKASIQSTTVLTDVFLKSKKRKQPGNEQGEMWICVHLPTGTTRHFEVEPSETIYSVMAKLEDIEGIPAKNQDLLFEHKLLCQWGGRTLADHNVVDGSVIDLLLFQDGWKVENIDLKTCKCDK